MRPQKNILSEQDKKRLEETFFGQTHAAQKNKSSAHAALKNPAELTIVQALEKTLPPLEPPALHNTNPAIDPLLPIPQPAHNELSYSSPEIPPAPSHTDAPHPRQHHKNRWIPAFFAAGAVIAAILFFSRYAIIVAPRQNLRPQKTETHTLTTSDYTIRLTEGDTELITAPNKPIVFSLPHKKPITLTITSPRALNLQKNQLVLQVLSLPPSAIITAVARDSKYRSNSRAPLRVSANPENIQTGMIPIPFQQSQNTMFYIADIRHIRLNFQPVADTIEAAVIIKNIFLEPRVQNS